MLVQEIKAQEENFPYALAAEHGYEAKIVGQKGFNGVAILTKGPAELVLDRLPGEDEDAQARYLEVKISGRELACLYLPNGNPISDEVKWPYKLRWMGALARSHGGAACKRDPCPVRRRLQRLPHRPRYMG